MRYQIMVSVVFGILVAGYAGAAEVTPEEKEALREGLEVWVTFYNNHDAESLAKEYTEDADVTNANGDRLVGRQAIHKDFVDNFSKNPHVRVRISDVQWKKLGPDLVIEEGTWEESNRSVSGSPTAGRYNAVLARKNGKWLVLHERPIGSPSQESLNDLKWMLGVWDVSGKLPDGTDFQGEQTWWWALDRNFIAGNIKAERDGELVVISRIMIAQDPLSKEIVGHEYWDDGYRGSFTVMKKGTAFSGGGVTPDGTKTNFKGEMDLAADKRSFSYEAKVTSGDPNIGNFELEATKIANRRRE